MNTEEFLQARKALAETQKRCERSKGVLSHLKKSLQDEFGCSSLEEAEIMLSDLESKTDALEAEAETKIEQFLRRWKDV